MQDIKTAMTYRRRHAGALLQAAQTLASAGRPASAAILRRGLEQERLLLAVAGRVRRIDSNTAPLSSQVRVAALLDEFSANSFGSVFQGTPLLPDRWQQQFEEARPQVFFCESAWSGADSKLRPWKGRVYASKNFKKENRGILLDILAHCRREGIPTIFWNKEDPTHYSDRLHDFVKTATEFDHVFTTAQECVARYKTDYGLGSVHALPFATNPALFNPIEQAPRLDVITFAGSWYANHTERSEDMHRMLRLLQSSGHHLEIYDRYYGDSDPMHKWPEEYTPFLHPAVPHDQVAAVYKRGRLALNINTVTQSRTMFARRVFELMSSNTLVLTNHSVGIEEMFGEDVIFCDRHPGRLASLSGREVDAMRERNLDLVLSKHTYRHRWEEILSTIGFRFRPAAETVTIVWPVATDEDARAGVTWFQQEADLSSDRLLLLATDAMKPLDVARLYETYNRFGITVTSRYHAEDLSIQDRYAPIQTDHMMLVYNNSDVPMGWLARARKHLQYAGTTPIAPANDVSLRYTHKQGEFSHALLMRTDCNLEDRRLYFI